MITQLAYNYSMKDWQPEQIKAFRMKLKLSQKAFGDILGVTRMHIYYIERGEREVSKTLKLLLNCVKERLKKGE